MADTTMEVQVEARLYVTVGSGSGQVTTGSVSQWMRDGAREIVHNIAKQGQADELFKFMRKITATSNIITITDDATLDSATMVLRFHDTKQDAYPCREVPIASAAKLNDTLSVEYATKMYPAFYFVSRNTKKSISILV